MNTIINSSKPIKKKKYPCYKIFDNGKSKERFIVLFTEYNHGIVVARDEYATRDIGVASSGWSEIEFKPFDGTIRIIDDISLLE